MKSEALAGAESIDARREAARWTNAWTEATYAAYYGISLLIGAEEKVLTTTQRLQQQFDAAKAAIDGVEGETKELTEAQYYEMAAEALLAGNTRLAQHYVDMATETGEAKRETLELIAALEALDGTSVSYSMVGFHQGMGGPSWLDQMRGPPVVDPGASEKARKIALWDAAHPSGVDSEGRGNPYRQYGGPVEAGKPYIVGEREAELFVPRQDGHIYNQQQLAGGDININTGISQRAFNNMAEDWMRGLGG